MKNYKIEKKITLDFLTHNDQHTSWIEDGIVETDGNNMVWYIDSKGEKHETINKADLIELYVRDGLLSKIK